MARTANINIRTEPETKAGAEQLFASFGISVSDAINIFLHQSLMVGGLPFQRRDGSRYAGSQRHRQRKNFRQAL